MAINIKKSGRKIAKKLSHVARKTRARSKEHIKENLIARVDNIRRIRILILEWVLLVTVVVLFAVVQSIWYGNSYQTSVFVPGGSYTEATLGKVSTLNPLYATTSSEKALARLMFSGLVTHDTAGRVGMEVARSIKPDETGILWTVKLKDGVKWSDGEPLGAEDVLYTFNAIVNPKSKTVYTSTFSGVKIAGVDDMTVEFELPGVYNGFPDTLTFPILPAHILQDVSPEHLYEDGFGMHPVGSGAFVYNATQNMAQDEQLIYLNKNPLYWRGEPTLDKMAIHTFASSERIARSINNVAVTATAELSPTEAKSITAASMYNIGTTINSGAFAFLNCESPIFENILVRQAVRQLIDMDNLREILDYGQPPLDYPVLPGQVEIETPELPEQDIEAAQEKLAEAGYTVVDGRVIDAEEEQLALRIATISSGYFPQLAEEMRKQLSDAGLAVSLDVYEPGTEFIASIIRPRDYDILLYEIEMGTNPDLFAYYHSSQMGELGLNLSNYSNILSDDLILAARGTLDKELAVAKYESFVQQWVEDVPAIGIYQLKIAYYFDKNVRIFSESNQLVTPLDRFADVIYWASVKDKRYMTP